MYMEGPLLKIEEETKMIAEFQCTLQSDQRSHNKHYTFTSDQRKKGNDWRDVEKSIGK